MNIKQMLVASRAVTSGTGNPCNFITIHETANQSPRANALAHARLQFNGNSRSASWHYSVDDKEIYQSFPDNVKCWHAGSSRGNTQSIGVEICVNSDGNFKKAVANAVELTQILMKRHNIPISNVVQHNFFSGKNCPTNLRNGSKGITWSDFINSVKNTSTPTPSTPSALKLGDTGSTVGFYQDKLNRAGYPLVIDNSFGYSMDAAVKKFQSDNRLQIDGYIGLATQAKLDEVLIAMRPKPEPEQPTITEGLKIRMYNPSSLTLRNSFALELAEAIKDGIITSKWLEQLEQGKLTLDDAFSLHIIIEQRRNKK